jgi:dTDP-glucose pyrophosphorylase
MFWSPGERFMNDVLSVILGGGRGSRLFPLTLQRSKPAVPIAGKYRLIDIPISNCLNSGLRRMFVLTQFNSESLNKHVSLTYKFDLFSSAFVSILAAEQTEDDPHWYQGTADAVRQSLRHLETHRWKEALILSGDQLYQMDYRKLMESHRRQVADVTVAVTPVTADQAHAFGILKVNKQGRIVHFDEKPPAERLDGLVSDVPGIGPTFLASMGIYMFGRDLLVRTVSDPSSSTSAATSSRSWSRRRAFTPTCIAATGRTSGPSSPTSTPTSPSASPCPRSTSTTPRARSSRTRGSCPPPRSRAARSRTRSSPKAPSSCRPRSGTRSSASAPASAAGCASRTA